MANPKYPAISSHETLNGTLFVDWKQEYQGEYKCPECKEGQFTRFEYSKQSLSKILLCCKSCSKRISLTCSVPVKIYRYLPNVTCPNPSCVQISPEGQKGWIYKINHPISSCQCSFCGIAFSETSKTGKGGWIGSQQEKELQPFDENEDIWDLYNFLDKDKCKTRYLNFKDIQPDWYCLKVKQYFCYLLKTKVYSSASSIKNLQTSLIEFGQIVRQRNLQKPTDISREILLIFIDSLIKVQAVTQAQKLSLLKQFLEWLELDANNLLKRRDWPKVSHSEPTWLDEPTRVAIREHLYKIPAPIARQYLVQEFTAARPVDICRLSYDCLVEENDRWYINLFQHKVNRWHRIPVTREIRRVIEEQQQWIRQQTFGQEYTYLFCHFRSFREISYPTFPTLKALNYPPMIHSQRNPMVKIMRCLIIQENIRDANGTRPHFNGKITRSSRLQEIRGKYGLEAAQLYADHINSKTTFQHYAPPTSEQIAQADLPFQELLLNPKNKFLPWQSLPESLLKNPKAHELDLEIAPRLVVYGHCALDPKTPCPVNLYPKCYGCASFRPSTSKLPLYERQYAGEKQRMEEAQVAAGASLAYEEAKATITAMEQWLPQLQEVANDT